jgi:4-amino-4-deoxy-L-arabinose transferase-like glycosyltransferase
MTRRNSLITVFLLALALRLASVILAYNLPIGLDDMFQYDMLARSIVAGNGYRWYSQPDVALFQQYFDMELPPDYDPRGVLTSFRPPGYPVFLALVYAVSGVEPHTIVLGGKQIVLTRYFFARLAQALLGALLVPLTWALARRIGFAEKTARWAAGFIAAWPLLIAYTLGLATENLFVVLLALGLVLLLRARDVGRARDHALAGIVLGLAALTRSIVSAFVPLVALWLWWVAVRQPFQAVRRGLKSAIQGIRNPAILFLCFLVVTVPWSVRNTLLHRRFTWIESALGYDLYMGYHPRSSGTFQYGISLDLMPILDDGARHERGMVAFWGFVRDDPGRIPYLMLRKAGYLWALDRRELTYFYGNGFLGCWPVPLEWLVFLLACGPLAVFAPAAALGLACGRMDGRKALLALLLAYYIGIHMLILAEPRFHLPLFAPVAVLAAYALVERPWRESRPWQHAVALALIALLLANWGLEVARDWSVLARLLGPEGCRLRLPY